MLSSAFMDFNSYIVLFAATTCVFMLSNNLNTFYPECQQRCILPNYKTKNNRDLQLHISKVNLVHRKEKFSIFLNANKESASSRIQRTANASFLKGKSERLFTIR